MTTATNSPTLPARTTPLRVALVGCGAVAKANLMPVLAGHDRLTMTTLVDRDEVRARELALAYSVPRVLTDLELLSADELDAVVLATPPAHHAPATVALASRGIHVFVEKPLAITCADAQSMVDAADRNSIVLSVGLYRRLLPAVRLLRTLIESGDFGRPTSIDIEEGGPYGWPLTTLAVLTSSAGGGGTLIDIGSHVIDLMMFLLPGETSVVNYEDNARGGIETDCLATFSIAARTGPIAARLELSRTRELRGSIRVTCEYATLELLRGNFTQIFIHRPATPDSSVTTPVQITAQIPGSEAFIGYDAFRAQIDDWVGAIVGSSTPELSGRSVVPVVRLIEECYRRRTAMQEPWIDEGLRPAERPWHSSPKLTRVLVTGAGGFLGGRTVELLSNRYGYETVALVKEPRSAARLARWPAEIVLGDVTSTTDIDRALQGCDAVVHCAVGTSWQRDEVRKVTVDGTRTVAEAALRAGVRRFVHISTMSVHRPDAVGLFDESVPLEPAKADLYGRNKLLAEEAVRAATGRGLSAIILRPTRIYGPFSKTFTVRPLDALSKGRLAVSGDPTVPANMVYVDNVVEAIACALEAPPDTTDAAYLISDSDQLSLRDFFNYFGRSSNATVRVVSESNALSPSSGVVRRWISGLRTIALSPEVRALVHRIMDTDPVGALPRRLWNLSPEFQRRLLRLFHVDAAIVYRGMSHKTAPDLVYYGGAAVVSSAKAERELGFKPLVSRDRAMALTLAWAQHARLVPGRSVPRDAA